jgi:small subunit ribosomal protein S6e
VSCYSLCPETQTPRIALKKQHTKKNKEEAAEGTKLLAKRVKEVKEKC